MLSRRLIAFKENTLRLCSKRGRLYLWTFTFAEKISVKEARKRWHHLQVIMRRWEPGLKGIRVFELHPGKARCGLAGVTYGESHGLHVHMVTTRFYWVNDIRSLARQAGFGRIDVQKVRHSDREKVASYLSKYLAKARPDELKGVRLVGYIGLSRENVRYRDIEFFGYIRDLWDAAAQFPTWHILKFHARCQFVNLLNIRCISEGTTPMVEVLDMIHGLPCETKLSRAYSRLAAAGADHAFNCGLDREAEMLNGNRFAPKSLKVTYN